MTVREAINKRKSVRKFKDTPISSDNIKEILRAGMAGPSAVNARPFEFIVIDDRELLNKIADGNGKAALMLKEAPLGIIVLMNMDKAYPRAPLFADIDCTIATQNMILAAYELGIGSCWLGTYPIEEKVNNQIKILELPSNLVPHSIIAFGYPTDDVEFENNKDKYEPNKVHYNGF